jgi:hypothetical protein
MAVGDSQDIYNRLIQNLPAWFGGGPDADGNNSNHPNLDDLLEIFITTYYYQYNNEYLYTILQERIQTATDINLDLISQDYMGNYLPRLANESDNTYRKRILANVIQIKATRPAMYNALLILTGFPPIIYEGWSSLDNMALGNGGPASAPNPLANNILTGGLSNFDNMGQQHTYGNEVLGSMTSGLFPYQFEIVVYLNQNQGLGSFPGLQTYPAVIAPNTTYFGIGPNNAMGYNWWLGSTSLVTSVITDPIIRQTIELTKTLGTNLAKLTIMYINP